MTTQTPHIVVVGGGFAGLEALRHLHKRLGDQTRLTLVSDRDSFVFRPYLSYLPFGLNPDQIQIDLSDFTTANRVDFIKAQAKALDPVNHTLLTTDGVLSFDFLVVATGAKMKEAYLPGVRDHAYALWRETDMVLLRGAFERLLRDAEQGATREVIFMAAPGCSWAGPLYESAFMLDTWLTWKAVRAHIRLHVVTPEERLLAPLGAALHDALVAEFERRHIRLHQPALVRSVDDQAVVCRNNERIPFNVLIDAPDYEAPFAWGALPTDERGFLKTILPTRQVQGYPNIYAVGDGSDFPVKQAYLALLQADAAAEHLAARVLDETPAFSFEPTSVWMMEQFDQSLLVHAPLGDASDRAASVEAVPPGPHRQPTLRSHLGAQATNPLYAGLLLKGTWTGVRLLSYLHKSYLHP